MQPAPRSSTAPAPKSASKRRSGGVPAGAARVMDQRHGQASNHVPIGFSSRISCAYGTQLAGKRSSQVPVGARTDAAPAAAAEALACASRLLLLLLLSPTLAVLFAVLPLLPPPSLSLTGDSGCRPALSRLAAEEENCRLHCCQRVGCGATATAAQLPVPVAAAALLLLEGHVTTSSSSMWAPATSILDREASLSSRQPPLRRQEASMVTAGWCKNALLKLCAWK